jgi:hypothetical protein
MVVVLLGLGGDASLYCFALCFLCEMMRTGIWDICNYIVSGFELVHLFQSTNWYESLVEEIISGGRSVGVLWTTGKQRSPSGSQSTNSIVCEPGSQLCSFCPHPCTHDIYQ